MFAAQCRKQVNLKILILKGFLKNGATMESIFNARSRSAERETENPATSCELQQYFQASTKFDAGQLCSDFFRKKLNSTGT